MNKTLIILATMGMALINATTNSAQELYKTPKPVKMVKNQITVSVIPQIELISIVQTIGNYSNILGFLMAEDSTEYKNDVIKYFNPYKNHPVVRMFDRLSSQPRMLNFSAPSNIMLYTDKYLQLRKDILLDTFVVNRAGGNDSLVLFLDLLRDFAKKTSFNKFYQNHQNYYSKIVKKAASNLGTHNYIAEVEKFYGKKQKSYNVVLVSLYNNVGFGNSLLYSDEKRDIFNTMGPKKIENGTAEFGDKGYFKYLIRHEFSHPFVNPLTEKYWSYIKSYAANYDLIPEKTKSDVCGDWQECINEFVIRAVTTYLAQNDTKEEAEKAYNIEKNRGVIYLDQLIDKIEIYQTNRNAYPTFESYYHKIMDTFKEKVQ